MSQFERSEMLLGKNGIKKLSESHVAVFGIGGVGSYVCEALCRCGVGTLTFIDGDVVCRTNINRQIEALHSTLGEYKCDAMKNRCKDINPDCVVNAINIFYTKENENDIDFTEFDYIVDAIDTVTSKLLIIERAKNFNIPIISSMGTGNKLDPTRFKITDISKTNTCPLARVIRRELKKRNIEKLQVLWSDETPLALGASADNSPASVSFVPSCAGLIIGGQVIKDLIK